MFSDPPLLGIFSPDNGADVFLMCFIFLGDFCLFFDLVHFSLLFAIFWS